MANQRKRSLGSGGGGGSGNGIFRAASQRTSTGSRQADTLSDDDHSDAFVSNAHAAAAAGDEEEQVLDDEADSPATHRRAVQPRGTAAHSTASDASASTRNTASNRAKGTRSSAAATSKKTSVKVHSFALDNDDEDEDDEGAGEQLKDDVVDGADEGRSDDEDADEEEYEVERILDHRKRRGKTEYLVKWKDYPDSENSWAWEDDMQAPEIIAAYLKSRKQTPKRPLVESARLSNASSARLSTGSKAGKGEELRGSESDEEITVKKVPKLAAKGSTASPASSKTAKKDESNGAVSSQKRKDTGDIFDEYEAMSTIPHSLLQLKMWEEKVESIDNLQKVPKADAGRNGSNLEAYVTLADGHKFKIPSETAYVKFPQKMLKYYEQHLTFL